MLEATCPICATTVRLAEIHERSLFPFCSERCRLIDLGRWLNERYSISTPLFIQAQNDSEDSLDD